MDWNDNYINLTITKQHYSHSTVGLIDYNTLLNILQNTK